MIAIKKGVFSIFISKILIGGLGLLMVVLLSRYLGAKGRGEISFFLSSVALLQLFIDFGNNTSIINLSYQHNKNALWKTALIWIFGTVIISAIVLLFLPDFSYKIWVPLAALLYSFINLNNLFLMGATQVNKRNLINVLLPLLLLILFYLLFHFHNNQFNYIYSLLIALSLTALVSYVFVKSYLNDYQGFEFKSILLKQGFWVQMGQAIQFFNYRISFFIISIVLGNQFLGVYNNAIVLAESIWILGHSLGQMLHIKILNSNNQQEILKLSNRFVKINFLATLAMILGLILIPNSFWVWLFSEEFSKMSQLFPYLSFGILFFSISNILNHYFHAKNRFKLILIANAIALLVGLITLLFLIQKYEIIGASIAWSLSFLAALIVYSVAYFKDLKLNFSHSQQSL